jgi:ketosteroid isomerase-like protein
MSAILDEWDMVYYLPKTFDRERNRVAMFGTCKWTNKATGKACEVMVAHLSRFRNGKAIEPVELFDSARAVAAATPDA